MGRVSYSLLCCSGWEEEDGDRLLECFQFLFIKGKWVAGLVVVLVLGFFFPCFELWCCSYANAAYFSCSYWIFNSSYCMQTLQIEKHSEEHSGFAWACTKST